MNGFKKEIQLVKDVWNRDKKKIGYYWIGAIVAAILGYLVLYLILHVQHSDIKDVLEKIRGKNSGANTSSKETYWGGTLHLLQNNWIVCLQIMILGLIPIPFFYHLSLLRSTAIIGIFLCVGNELGLNIWKSLFLGILPHGILEITVFIITTIYAGRVNHVIVRWLTNLFRRAKKKKPCPPFWKTVKQAMLVFIFVVTPLIAIAAFIEGYVTRFLFGS